MKTKNPQNSNPQIQFFPQLTTFYGSSLPAELKPFPLNYHSKKNKKYKIETMGKTKDKKFDKINDQNLNFNMQI